MRASLLIFAVSVMVAPATSRAQFSVEMSYGIDRNVQSTGSELDGWLNLSIDWISSTGVGLGIGTDHQFEGTSLDFSGHQSWAIYLSPSFERPVGLVAPFVRGGLGLGRAPCQGDTCGDGLYLRASVGMRVRVVERIRISGEVGVSRVSRPFGGVGVSLRI